MADKFIFTMLRMNKHYGTRQVLKDINLSFFPGAKIGIVGSNGAGKSTVLRIMAGLDDDFDGVAEITPGYTAGIVEQEPRLDPDRTVRQTLEDAFGEIQKMLREYDEVTAKLGESLSDEEMQKTMDRMAVLQDRLDAVDAWNLDQKLDVASDAMVLPEDDRAVGTLSGGEKRRVALCRVLLEQPDLLLLDEPTNHLDAETVDWLEGQLREYPGTVIIVTHDRYFLDNVTKWILELDSGRGIPWEGNYSSWIEQKLGQLSQEAKDKSPRAKFLQRELNWIKMSNQDRNDLSRIRLIEFEQLVAQEKNRDSSQVLTINPGPPLGEQVVVFDKVSKGYGGSPLFDDLSFSLPKGAVVGLVGPNGAGKTTLFKLVTGDEQPDEGTVTLGSTVVTSHVDQLRDSSDPNQTLLAEIGEGRDDVEIGGQEIPIRKYLALFDFKGDSQQKTIGQLSGGEHNRAYLAKMLKIGGNLLLLDEPTNDLDVNTLRLLEEAIHAFAGNIMVISHDRFFLDRVCTHLLVFEGESNVRFFTGNFAAYEEWRKKEIGTGLFENRRNRYRRLVRA